MAYPENKAHVWFARHLTAAAIAYAWTVLAAVARILRVAATADLLCVSMSSPSERQRHQLC